MSAIGSGAPLQSASAIVAGTKSGEHLLKIAGYSRITKDVETGSSIRSRSFQVGGHSWHISYYPNGINSDWSGYISIYLGLDHHQNVAQGVKAQYTFSLLDHGGKPVRTRTSGEAQIFSDSRWGFAGFLERDELEKSEHLRDDWFTIRCEITVLKEIHTKDVDVDAATRPLPPAVVVVPPPDLHRHLGSLLKTGEGADVAFEVDGKTFPAHKLVLAARSPVLHAELISDQQKLVKESSLTVVRIDDMEAQDFEAFLHYIYTDTLPEMNKGSDAAAMLPDLVAAANRYKMERLRLVCEEKLCEFVNARTVAAMLGFAGEHHCNGLKEACLRFLENAVNLRELVKVDDGLAHLSESCPSVLKDLIAKLASDAIR